MKRELVTTKDQSRTLYVKELDEYYHSVHGALQESEHVFIRAGLHHFISRQKEIHVLEVGFGTGLNALLTLEQALTHSLSIRYTGLEKFPVLPEEAVALDYPSLVSTPSAALFSSLHAAAWEEEVSLLPDNTSASFLLCKKQIDLKLFTASASFDLIYFDAFAPSAQPDLWTPAVMETLYTALKPGGLLVTYCVKGTVRRAMQSVGFTVEKIPGPPGKREMARAWKN